MKTFVQIGNGEQSALPPEEKEELLLSRLAGIPSLIVALSGGADSAYLAWASNRALGERALSVTALSPSFSAYDREMVEQFAKQLALCHEFIETQRQLFCKLLDHFSVVRGKTRRKSGELVCRLLLEKKK